MLVTRGTASALVPCKHTTAPLQSENLLFVRRSIYFFLICVPAKKKEKKESRCTDAGGQRGREGGIINLCETNEAERSCVWRRGSNMKLAEHENYSLQHWHG